MTQDNRFPSQTLDAYWVYADNETHNYHLPRGADGKWLFFEHVSAVDATWEKIRTATRQGLFGNTSKTATAKPSRNAFDPTTKVICVYTNDLHNTVDVERIRKAIRALGIDNKLIYKLNRDVGKYHKDGHRNLSQLVDYSAAYYKIVDWLIQHPRTKYIHFQGENQWGQQQYNLQQQDMSAEVFEAKLIRLRQLGLVAKKRVNEYQIILPTKNH